MWKNMRYKNVHIHKHYWVTYVYAHHPLATENYSPDHSFGNVVVFSSDPIKTHFKTLIS